MAARKKTRKKADAEVNIDWASYFDSIRSVCPWSSPAFKNGKIKIQDWQGIPESLESNTAIVYVHKHASARLLKKIADRMNSARPAEEWLYSHPQYKHYSTEVPVLIQQDLAHLESVRRKREE